MWVTTAPQAVHMQCGRGSYPSRFLGTVVLQNTLTVMHDQCVTAPPKKRPLAGFRFTTQIGVVRSKKGYPANPHSRAIVFSEHVRPPIRTSETAYHLIYHY